MLPTSIISQTIAEGIELGFSEKAITEALVLASDWAESYTDDENEASVLPGIYDCVPGWESVQAPPHIRVRYASLQPGSVSQINMFPI